LSQPLDSDAVRLIALGAGAAVQDMIAGQYAGALQQRDHLLKREVELTAQLAEVTEQRDRAVSRLHGVSEVLDTPPELLAQEKVGWNRAAQAVRALFEHDDLRDEPS
jgi:hypothetical protein